MNCNYVPLWATMKWKEKAKSGVDSKNFEPIDWVNWVTMSDFVRILFQIQGYKKCYVICLID